jgi:hypothetical protein
VTFRIRYGVECSSCLTRYLIAFSPYRNGSYVISYRLMAAGYGSEEYRLYCSCGHPSWPKLRRCAVAPSAFRRGYGSVKEIVWIASIQEVENGLQSPFRQFAVRGDNSLA